MSEFKGTKGPWILYPITRDLAGQVRNAYISNVKDDSPGIGDIGIYIRVDNSSEQTDIANAKLISKAPEMLEMLKRVKDWYDSDDIINDHLPIEEIEQLIKEATEI